MKLKKRTKNLSKQSCKYVFFIRENIYLFHLHIVWLYSMQCEQLQNSSSKCFTALFVTWLFSCHSLKTARWRKEEMSKIGKDTNKLFPILIKKHKVFWKTFFPALCSLKFQKLFVCRKALMQNMWKIYELISCMWRFSAQLYDNINPIHI